MKRVRLALIAALMVPVAPALPFVAEHVHALAGDPVVTVTVSPAAPVAGDLVTFHTCVDQAGYVPGGQKITRTNRSTRSTRARSKPIVTSSSVERRRSIRQ